MKIENIKVGKWYYVSAGNGVIFLCRCMAIGESEQIVFRASKQNQRYIVVLPLSVIAESEKPWLFY